MVTHIEHYLSFPCLCACFSPLSPRLSTFPTVHSLVLWLLASILFAYSLGFYIAHLDVAMMKKVTVQPSPRYVSLYSYLIGHLHESGLWQDLES